METAFPPGQDAYRPWVPASLEDRIHSDRARYAPGDADTLDAALHSLLEEHVEGMDRQAISLYAGTNVMNPAAAALLAHPIGVRPSLGYPGAKYEAGMAAAEQVEILAATVLARVFDCRFVELRVPSGSLANLYAYAATCRPGDLVVALPSVPRAMSRTTPRELRGSTGSTSWRCPTTTPRCKSTSTASWPYLGGTGRGC